MNTVDIQCRGIDTAALDKPIVPLNEWKQYDKLIDITRRAFYTEHSSDFSREKNNGHFAAGPRFKSNYAVMERIVSACPTREFFEANLKAWITTALDDCARADYWYEYEKDYGEGAE